MNKKVKIVEYASNATGRYLHLSHNHNSQATDYIGMYNNLQGDGYSVLDEQPLKLVERKVTRLYTWMSYYFKRPKSMKAGKPILSKVKSAREHIKMLKSYNSISNRSN